MNTKTLFNLLIFFIMANSCANPASQNPENWNEKKLTEWFNTGDWKLGWMITPDESINQKELAAQIYKNSERWEKAFQFLKSNNLNEIDLGRYELEGENLYVNVDEYTTRNEEDTKYEAHRKYADIQYLVSGEEKIGVIPIENAKEVVPYDSTKDYLLLTSEENNYRIASPENFFVFFPDDAHRPGVKTNENIKVRKVVVKVRIN